MCFRWLLFLFFFFRFLNKFLYPDLFNSIYKAIFPCHVSAQKLHNMIVTFKKEINKDINCSKIPEVLYIDIVLFDIVYNYTFSLSLSFYNIDIIKLHR